MGLWAFATPAPRSTNAGILSTATVFRVIKLWSTRNILRSKIPLMLFGYWIIFQEFYFALVGKSEGNKSNLLFTFLITTFDISNFLTEKKDKKHYVDGSFEKAESMCDCLSKKG